MGASLLFFGVFVVMMWVASGRVAYLRDGIDPVRGGRADRVPGAAARAGTAWTTGCTRSSPAKVHQVGYGQLAQRWFALASGGMVGTGLGRGSPDLIPYSASDFILVGVRRGAGHARHGRDPAALPRADRTRAADRPRSGGRLRPAPRDRPHDDHRAADVHDRGRRDSAHPAHRRPAAARVATAAPAASRPS